MTANLSDQTGWLVGWPLYRSTCVSQHHELRTGAKYYSLHALADAIRAIGLGRIWYSSPQWCYLYCLRII